MNTILLFFKNNRRLLLVAVAIVALLAATQALAAFGSLDPTFGTNGIVIADLGSSSDSVSDIALQPDGRIIMMGSATSQLPILMRYNSNGSVDATFGTNGKLTLNFGSKVAIQPDGKLVVAGSSNHSFAVARYNSNGASLDNTFGTNGVAIIPSDPREDSYSVSDLAIESDGKIVVVGTLRCGQCNFTDIVIAHFNSDGTPYDTDFSNGLIILDKFNFPNNRYNSGQAVAIQSDGKIVISGGMMDNDGEGQISLARLNTDGLSDKTFGTNGKGTITAAVTAFHYHKSSMVLQTDGRIVVVGTTSDGDDLLNDLVVARFNGNGVLDTTFGGTGIAITDFGGNEFGTDVHLQADGRIIAVGTSSTSGSDNLLIVRYNADGSLDTAFGDNGKLIGGLGNGSSSGAGIEIQPNGKFIVVGSSNGDAFLARYNVSDATGILITDDYESIKSFDGSILESAENSDRGGAVDRYAVTFNVGDDQKDRQYRGILSFNTSSIPDDALITSAQVKIKKQGVRGTVSMYTDGDLLLDMRNGFFGKSLTLQADDFAAPASPGALPEGFASLNESWYAVNLSVPNLGFINKMGMTQFRVRFSLDDNDDRGADYIKFYSGNSAEANRPQLIITYILDSGSPSSMRQSSLPIVGGANQPPTITSNGGSASASLSVQENASAMTTVTATDADLPAETLTYSITGGADSTHFNINASTGELTFIAPPDFEIPTDAGLDNIYNVTVQASDGTLSVTQDLIVTVSAVNDNTPIITSVDRFTAPENTSSVTIITATDADLPAETLTYSITGGADSTRFNINASTGELTFIAPPDFELPTDAGLDNIYNVTVQASDGTLSVTQDMVITVSAVNDNTPVITSVDKFTIPENTSSVTTVAATDADLPAETLTYSITGGVDTTRFNINASTGELIFIAPPDFEIPTDADLDNIYNVTVQASDGTLSVTQDLVITVSAVND
ncbi:MAG: cadherin domain-containing protein, partial [Anaerolineales bacterium]|nr:cadherin domain-containing protein [Anaerolineales bacterium]